ncbi:SDR family oxidoreductase [Microbacterium sp. BWT-B31]|uniref:SDR family NAD(P)-dependent oxidoreductase n=1 Tax=Microbacterium sp. BWT-B31 TaxID=3232072 RepID=UPI003528A4CE
MSLQSTPSVVVTGGASGIGRATVLRMLDEGWSVVAADMNPDSLARLAEEVGGGADRLATIVANVAVEEDVSAAVALAVDRFGGLTGIANNAGVGGAFGSIAEIEAEDWDYTFDVVARGVFFGIKYAVRAMREQGVGGSIVNTGSVAAFNGGGGPAIYSAAKAAVVNLTKASSIELAGDLIRVNAVCPGVIYTPLLEKGLPEEARTTPPLSQPWPRWGKPEDIAAAIAFLLGPDSTFMTGQTLTVDGGLMAAGPGPEFARTMGIDARHLGMVGVNRGSTGVKSQVRRRTP